MPGGLVVTLAATYLIEYKTQSIPGGPFVENAGTLAQNGQYDYRTNLRVGYTGGVFDVGINWRHLPSIENAAAATNPNTTMQGAGAYDLFDLSANWNINSTVSLRVGIDNLFNTDPEIYRRQPGRQRARQGSHGRELLRRAGTSLLRGREGLVLS